MRCLLLLLALGAAWEPKVERTSFENVPSRLYYFPSSSSILSFDGLAGSLWHSQDDGATWSRVEEISSSDRFDGAWVMEEHPFDEETAFVLTEGTTHYKTKDKGRTWKTFTTDAPPSLTSSQILSFSKQEPDYALYMGYKCSDDWADGWGDCEQVAYYTTDGFETKPAVLTRDTHGCVFAQSTESFSLASPKTVVCVFSGDTIWLEDRLMRTSSDWFVTSTTAVAGGRPITGVSGLGALETFLVAAVVSLGTDEMALYVSDDAVNWARAQFPSDDSGILKQDAYTLLSSPPYSIRVDVLTSVSYLNPTGALFSSNSNGTYFTKLLDHTNRAFSGLVDYEKIQNIQGIVMANVVDNWKRLEKDRSLDKKLVTRISFDEGRKWQPLEPPVDGPCESGDGCSVHLHSITSLSNVGNAYSSPAPGLVLGVGSVGASLDEYKSCDLYISDDAGLTWRFALQGPYKYAFGDAGSIVLAIKDDGKPVSMLWYSPDRGASWDTMNIGSRVIPQMLATSQDATTQKFLLVATDDGEGSSFDRKTSYFAIDFAGLHDRKCDPEKDFERWYARYDEDGKPDCLMGHKQFFLRRKADADCYVGDTYHYPEPIEEICKCSKQDFECDYNFIRDESGNCVPAGLEVLPPGACSKPEDKYMGSSGYRLLPGNDCEREGGESLDEPVEKQCNVALAPSGKITHNRHIFSGNIKEYHYLERSETSSGDDETVIVRTDNNEIWRTRDQGGSWEEILEYENIVAIYLHPYKHDICFFLTSTTTAYISRDRARTFESFRAPTAPNPLGINVMEFHPTKTNQMMWIGSKHCGDLFGSSCHAVAYFTEDGGEWWEEMLSYVQHCAWLPPPQKSSTILCEKYKKESGSQQDLDNNALQLVSSDNSFEEVNVVFPNIVGFTIFEEFIIVAQVEENEPTLKMDISIDGHTFAPARFPANFQLDHQQAYTVLDSVTHAVFMHVTTGSQRGREIGSVIKSNSNGTSYTMSLESVNRNANGFVDFEKMLGLEGVAIANVVSNVDELESGTEKALKTTITHNDGGEWAVLTPPSVDSEGNGFDCSGDCTLHLHGFTERKDRVRDAFSSPSAVGLLIGVGSVGPKLKPVSDSDTFLSRDGGISWKEAVKGSHMWEFGDQGSIIVLAADRERSHEVMYSLNEGETWQTYAFTTKEKALELYDIATVPSDTSRSFLLFGREKGNADAFVTRIDFTGLTNVQCTLDTDKPDEDDFELWTPSHPFMEENCLFGHEAQYHRKIPDRDCFVGPRVHQPHKLLRNCTCVRQDYECDLNYERASDGSCQLVPGYTPPDHSAICTTDKDLIEFFEPTGYRRIPLTTCQGGLTLDQSTAHPCPGREEEFEARRGVHGLVLVCAIVLPIAAALGIGWWIWRKTEGKFGQIRLGEEDNRTVFIRYPILILSAIVAVAMTLPSVARAASTAVRNLFTRNKRFTSRRSFHRNGYAGIQPEEGDEGLLGVSDDESV